MTTNLNETFAAVQVASRELALLNDDVINQILNAVADAAIAETPFILSENEKDLARMDKNDPKYDRLKLTEERLKGIAADTRNVATLPSPLGKVLKESVRPNGMKLTKVSVPFGVIGIIYEARPNVSFDVFSLCLKSGNACILKGGSDADCSNRAIISVIHKVLKKFKINPHIVELLPADREATAALLNAVGYVDLIIPRGSSSLIHFVRENARIPVIETGAGICHTYFDEFGDTNKGADIIHNAALFTRIVDAACVYTNVSTAFTDGAQFGLGAEIGISTQKLHARGPMGLEEITSYKWVIEGDGQTRRN